MINTDFIKGIIVPILTPIDKDENIDEAKLRFMVDHVIDGGVHGILAYGSNGEFYGVEEKEMERGLRIIVDQAAKRVPVYMGIGSITTKQAIRLAKMGQAMGADGVSVLQPMFIKPSEEELYDHFAAIASAVPDFPVLLYNNPARTGYGISVNLAMRLCDDCENIVGIKDSSGDMTLTSEFIRQAEGRNFKVLGGKDTLIFGAMAYGAAGCVTTTANMFPELVVSIYDKCVAGDYKGALEAQRKLTPIRLQMDKASFPVGTKDLANLMGLDVGDPYLPNHSSKGSVVDNMRSAIRLAGYDI